MDTVLARLSSTVGGSGAGGYAATIEERIQKLAGETIPPSSGSTATCTWDRCYGPESWLLSFEVNPVSRR
ncbi:hypothetical protein BZL30_9429 [Mycobacterium kansasii]|uniref:Uncharacterized protein n=1 Tax=Mycobacterium kansasii TaxID=1768 RepID=A0A1V3WA38_MYCKA|nr:hypothetical protein BZL30_9429 [Mycobacterium kansasii]